MCNNLYRLRLILSNTGDSENYKTTRSQNTCFFQSVSVVGVFSHGLITLIVDTYIAKPKVTDNFGMDGREITLIIFVFL